MKKRLWSLVSLSVVALALIGGTHSAIAGGKNDPLKECFGPGPLTQEEAEMTCVKQGDGEWTPVESDRGRGSSGSGGLIVLGLFLSLLPAFVGYSVANSQDLNPWLGFGVGIAFSWIGVFGVYLYGRSLKEQGPKTRSEPDPTVRLRRLQQLLNDGLITQEEYEERRRAALDAI